jgi:hypothetical protein
VELQLRQVLLAHSSGISACVGSGCRATSTNRLERSRCIRSAPKDARARRVRARGAPDTALRLPDTDPYEAIAFALSPAGSDEPAPGSDTINQLNELHHAFMKARRATAHRYGEAIRFIFWKALSTAAERKVLDGTYPAPSSRWTMLLRC